MGELLAWKQLSVWKKLCSCVNAWSVFLWCVSLNSVCWAFSRRSMLRILENDTKQAEEAFNDAKFIADIPSLQMATVHTASHLFQNLPTISPGMDFGGPMLWTICCGGSVTVRLLTVSSMVCCCHALPEVPCARHWFPVTVPVQESWCWKQRKFSVGQIGGGAGGGW